MSNQKNIKETIKKLLPEAENFLIKLISFPSTSGNEHEAMLFSYEELKKLKLDVEKIYLSASLKKDPDYSDPIPDISYEGRFNVRAVRKGKGYGKKLILNAHIDVVPPNDNMAEPWSGKNINGIIFGRGACDAKGQAATAYLVLKTLDTINANLKGDIITHLVVEEENGGNGSLAMIRKLEKADGAIILEPSEKKIITSIRGAVWFKLLLKGKSGHSGAPDSSHSALLMAKDAINALEKYHADLLKESQGIPLFDAYPNPMPITFGSLQAGNWPATAPNQAVLKGVLGFLPNKTKEKICSEMRRALEEGTDPFFKDNFELKFMYRHDNSVIDPNHELPQSLKAATEHTGAPEEIGALPASADAWFYNNQLNIPTIIFGPGSMKFAHSEKEQISLAEIEKAAEILVTFILNYCG
jgi:acetylornithine deacetylase